ncbi:Xylose isomerase domain protein TIM barrel [Methanosalsum zhilinae DSM 4017]|uniref:Xylose isomerase domain protein TIM barrel n=1 Tax=Methanosalsum zhilinae (strain DSM 4017 / NBRC 107636 / OCM 62 / WeN5) TaxID=679901 RepID=F7XKQ5_METZD|nr:TIM barrel protein [Methanosalsum zhilinae]AEH61768.1 Xylose isomerase domain protein TIM barrel [Methanosalsum zhilinae DSM 4017]
MAHSKLLFGTAGTPHSSRKKSSIEGIRRIHELGLGCMELEFVRGVKMGEKTARKIHDTSRSENVKLSVHAPYYINLNSMEEDKVKSSIERIYKSARIGALCGADSIVFHPAYYQKTDPVKVYQKVAQMLVEIRTILDDEGINVTLRPESTGKGTQFGSIDEILQLSAEIEGVLPCIDFSHLYARSKGKVNSYKQFYNVMTMTEEFLGREGLDNLHMHVSGIEYGNGGEKKHLNLEDADFNYMDLLRTFHEFDIKGLVICESPNLETDAMILKNKYQELKKQQ